MNKNIIKGTILSMCILAAGITAVTGSVFNDPIVVKTDGTGKRLVTDDLKTRDDWMREGSTDSIVRFYASSGISTDNGVEEIRIGSVTWALDYDMVFPKKVSDFKCKTGYSSSKKVAKENKTYLKKFEKTMKKGLSGYAPKAYFDFYLTSSKLINDHKKDDMMLFWTTRKAKNTSQRRLSGDLLTKDTINMLVKKNLIKKNSLYYGTKELNDKQIGVGGSVTNRPSNIPSSAEWSGSTGSFFKKKFTGFEENRRATGFWTPNMTRYQTSWDKYNDGIYDRYTITQFWTSSDPSVASVDSTGTVTGLKAGTSKITVEYIVSNDRAQAYSFTRSYTVTVK